MSTLIETNEIPIIDLRLTINELDTDPPLSLIDRLAIELDVAFSKFGTALLINHGIDENQLQLASAYFKKFCQLSPQVKDRYRWTLNHGYVRPNLERFDEEISEERHCFNFGNIVDDEEMPYNELPGFKENFLAVVKGFNQLQRLVLKALAVTLKIPQQIFIDAHTFIEDDTIYGSIMRLLHYPAIPMADTLNRTRCGAHCDYGTFTLLSQDSEGGLEILQPDTNVWRRVGYMPGAVFLNGGEILEIWSKQRYPAVCHRVIIPEEDCVRNRERNARAIFVHLKPDVPVGPIELLLNTNDRTSDVTFKTFQEVLEKKFQDSIY